MRKLNFHFEVEVNLEEVSTRYNDRHFRYTIKNNSDINSDEVVKRFCMSIVQLAVEKKDQVNWAQPYVERFEKVKERTYEYWVVEPNVE